MDPTMTETQAESQAETHVEAEQRTVEVRRDVRVAAGLGVVATLVAAAYVVRVPRPCWYCTPTARPPSTTTFSASAPVRTVRLGRSAAGSR